MRKLSRTDKHLTWLTKIKKLEPIMTDHQRPERLAEKSKDIQWDYKNIVKK